MKKKFHISKKLFDGVIFDLDGVITQSAKIHARAWKEMFDTFLEDRSNPLFDIDKDYYAYVDGKPRYEGVRSLLVSRNIELPYGSPDDDPEEKTICGLGNRKNRLFLKYLKADGIKVYKTSVDLVKELLRTHFKVGLVTSSKNCSEIVKAGGVDNLFDIQVDGIMAVEKNLKGKPNPDIFLVAADELEVKPDKAVVIEDAVSGIKAGAAGHFGCVIAVNRSDNERQFIESGADVVVNDLCEIGVEL